jgi:diguanylate cyclase (GGDEF)-like protein
MRYFESLAFVDDLTRLYNRRYLFYRLKSEIKRSKKFSILVIDLDHFKEVNDAFGHLRGDHLLVQVAEVLKSSVRDIDTVFRYAGDEFVILLPRTGKEEAIMVGERVLSRLHNTVFEGDPPLKIRASIGIATYPEDGKDSSELLGYADRGVYAAKRMGSGTVGIAKDMDLSIEISNLRSPRLIARERELALLNLYFDEALSGKTKFVLISGEAGIGKTRLIEEFLKIGELRGTLILSAKCYEMLKVVPYGPFKEIFKEMVETEMALDVLRALPKTIQMEIIKFVPEAAERLEFPIELILKGAWDEFRLYDSITSFFRKLQEKSPLVIFLDDLQWADTSSLNLLSFLSKHLKSLFFLGAYRPEEAEISQFQEYLEKEGVLSTIHLERLSKEETKWLMRSILREEFPDTLEEDIFRISQGVPLFVEEILKKYIESRALYRKEERWNFDTSKVPGIPTSLESLVERRLRGVPSAVRNVLEVASVFEEKFRIELLSKVTSINEGELLGHIEEAIKRGFLLEEEIDGILLYRFSHEIIREVLYSKLTKGKRKKLHRLIGEAIESLYGGKREEVAESLAEHYWKAGVKDKALEYSLLAGDKCALSYAYSQALVFYTRAIELSSNEKDRIEILLKRGETYRNLAKLKEAEGDFMEAKRRATALDLDELKAKALHELAFVHQRQGYLEKATREIEEGLKLLEGEKYSVTKADLLTRLLDLYRMMARHQEAISLGEEALYIYRKLSDKRGISKVYNGLGALYLALGKYDLARKYFKRALSLNRRTGDLPKIAVNLSNLGVIENYEGKYRRAYNHLEEAIKIFEETGNRWGIAAALINLGATHTNLGEYVKAIHTYERALNVQKKLEYRMGEAVTLRNLAALYLEFGEPQRANLAAQNALKISKELGDKAGMTSAYSLLGTILFSIGKIENALNTFESASNLSDETRLPREEVHNLIGRGNAMRELRNFDFAFTHLKKALDISKKYNLQVEHEIVISEISRTLIEQGNLDEASRFIRRISQKSIPFDQRVRVLFLQGLYEWKRGEYPKAQRFISKGINMMKKKGLRRYLIEGLLFLGKINFEVGDLKGADSNFRKALRLSEKCEFLPLLNEVHMGLYQIAKSSGREREANEHRERVKYLTDRMLTGVDEIYRNPFEKYVKEVIS